MDFGGIRDLRKMRGKRCIMTSNGAVVAANCWPLVSLLVSFFLSSRNLSNVHEPLHPIDTPLRSIILDGREEAPNDPSPRTEWRLVIGCAQARLNSGRKASTNGGVTWVILERTLSLLADPLFRHDNAGEARGEMIWGRVGNRGDMPTTENNDRRGHRCRSD